MKNTTAARREELVNFAVLCTWLIASAMMALLAYVQYGQDFRGYYAAAKVLLTGGNPYDYNQVAAVLLAVTGRAGNNPFYYPLWFGWFITPLTVLPFQLARAVWMLFNWVLWIVGLIRLRGLLDWPSKGWRAWLMFLAATFIFAWITWRFEQTGILLFAISVEILVAYREKKWTRMGLYLALALIKPNIMLLPVAALGVWLLKQKQFRPVIVMSTVLVGLIFITTIITPNWYRPMLQPNFGQGLTDVLDGPNQITGTRLNTTLLDWLKLFMIPAGIRNVIYAMAIISGVLVLGFVIWKSNSVMQVAVTSLLVNFAITPYALQYDFPPLVIPLFWGTALSFYAASKRSSVFYPGVPDQRTGLGTADIRWILDRDGFMRSCSLGMEDQQKKSPRKIICENRVSVVE